MTVRVRVKPINRTVTCQRCGVYVGLLKIIKPDTVFERTDMAPATLQIHAKVVIQPCMNPQNSGAP